MKRVLARLVEANTAGDPMSYLVWTNKSTRDLISMNWRGRPLLSHGTVVNLIAPKTTKSGLWVKALLNTSEYEPRQKITDEEMRTLRLKRHKFSRRLELHTQTTPRSVSLICKS